MARKNVDAELNISNTCDNTFCSEELFSRLRPWVFALFMPFWNVQMSCLTLKSPERTVTYLQEDVINSGSS